MSETSESCFNLINTFGLPLPLRLEERVYSYTVLFLFFQVAIVNVLFFQVVCYLQTEKQSHGFTFPPVVSGGIDFIAGLGEMHQEVGQVDGEGVKSVAFY